MGEYAEMMLDGTCCASCGEYLFNDDPAGYPVYCAGCEPDFIEPEGRRLASERVKPPRNQTCAFKGCNRKFRTHDAYLQHYRDKHDKAS